MIKGKLTFYCRMLHVSRPAFYKYLQRKDQPWKYQKLADAMRDILKEDECNDTYGRSRMRDALLQKDGSITYSLHWDHYFKHIVEKYNSIYKVQMPEITPHVCRHTYCSNMAKSGMNPKTLQYLMGHADIGTTLNVYTHVNFEDAKAEIEKLNIV